MCINIEKSTTEVCRKLFINFFQLTSLNYNSRTIGTYIKCGFRIMLGITLPVYYLRTNFRDEIYITSKLSQQTREWRSNYKPKPKKQKFAKGKEGRSSGGFSQVYGNFY